MRSEGSADLKSGVRFQLTSTQMTPAKEMALSRKTQAEPVSVRLKAATMSPPSAGPAARARLLLAELSETVSGMRLRGTSSGMMACHAGLFMAGPMLRRKGNARDGHGEMCPRKVISARTATEASIQDCQKMRSRRRSKMSAVAPPSRPSRSTGSDAAVCIRAIRSGEAVSDVMSHVPAVSCIQVPMDETVEATQRSRKSGMRRGSKPETEGMGETTSVAGPVLGDSKGIALISVYGLLDLAGRAVGGIAPGAGVRPDAPAAIRGWFRRSGKRCEVAISC